jgi:hypothetical protein
MGSRGVFRGFDPVSQWGLPFKGTPPQTPTPPRMSTTRDDPTVFPSEAPSRSPCHCPRSTHVETPLACVGAA